MDSVPPPAGRTSRAKRRFSWWANGGLPVRSGGYLVGRGGGSMRSERLGKIQKTLYVKANRGQPSSTVTSQGSLCDLSAEGSFWGRLRAYSFAGASVCA
jgi:hypothetical protein